MNFDDKISSRDDFLQEKIFLAKKYNKKLSSIIIDEDHPCGEICIFISGDWYGYIDEEFRLEMLKSKIKNKNN